MSSTSYFHVGSRYVTRFQDFAPNYGACWMECPLCGWWDRMGHISRVREMLNYATVWDTFMCGDCRLSEEPWIAIMPSSSSSSSSWYPGFEYSLKELWLMCPWCGWWDSFRLDRGTISIIKEHEDYPCYDRCSRCAQLDEPPWWPNNRQRYAQKLMHLLPTVGIAITATEIVERTMPCEVIRLIAEYLAANTP